MANLTRENLPTEIITDDSENFKLGNLAGLFANTSTNTTYLDSQWLRVIPKESDISYLDGFNIAIDRTVTNSFLDIRLVRKR